MKRALAVIAALVIIALTALLVLHARKKTATVPTAASASLAPPLVEPPELVLAKTTKTPAEIHPGDLEVTGIVKDIAGGTVGGATVTVTMMHEGSKVGQIVQSDANGEIHAWVDAGAFQAIATADGYSGATWSGIAPGQRIELVLTPESVLQGRVVEAGTDVPVAGALVVADSQDDDVSSKAVTDTEGRFRIRGLSPGHYKPEAVTPNRWGTARASVLLGLAETVNDVVIEVHPSLAVRGRVFRGEAGCPGATLSLTDRGLGDARSADADGDGNVQIEGVFPGSYDVVVRCSGGLDTTFPPLVVKEAPVGGLEWRTETGFTVRGTLFDDRGRTVAGADVVARRKGDTATAETEADGTFAIRALRGGRYELVATPLYMSSDEALDEVTVDHDVEGVRLTLPASGAVRGSIVDDRGAPVHGVAVEIDGDDVPGHAERIVQDDGTFLIEGLPPGLFHVGARRGGWILRLPGITDDALQFRKVTVTKGGTATVKLVVASERGVIRGRVVDGAKNPLTDVFVEPKRQAERPADPAGAPKHFDRSDFGDNDPVIVGPDGRFTIENLGPGTYAVRAFRKGGGDAILNDVALGSDVTLVIEDEASVSGVVVGAKPERFNVGVHDTAGEFSRVESFFRTDGAFSLRDIPAGTYDLVVDATEGRGTSRVTLAPGDHRADLRLTIVPFGRVRGRVVASDGGSPVEGLDVLLNDDGDSPNGAQESATTDRDGRFEIARVPAGKSVLTILSLGSEELRSYTETVAIAPGQTVDVPEIRLAPAAD